MRVLGTVLHIVTGYIIDSIFGFTINHTYCVNVDVTKYTYVKEGILLYYQGPLVFSLKYELWHSI